MPKLIPDFGPRSAKLIVIGEAPGKSEFEQGRPFCGASGRLLDEWMLKFGIDRSSVLYTNVCRYWPGEFAPAQLKAGLNDWKWLPKGLIEQERVALWERLAALEDPWLIVPTGNHALQTLFNDGRKISDYRGSILSIELAGRRIKVIPTVHPAATFRRPILGRFCLADWGRISGDLGFRDTRIPPRHTVIAARDTFDEFMGSLGTAGGPLALDIECSTTDGSLQCLAAAYEPESALVVALQIPGCKRSDPIIQEQWDFARRLCGPIHLPRGGAKVHNEGFGGSVPKVLQNGLFDQFILARKGGITLEDYIYDTQEAEHLLNLNDGSDPQAAEDSGDDIKISMRSLAVLCSLYTRQPYYKGESKDGFKFGWNRVEQLWDYNALDAMITIEVWQKQFNLLKERGLI